MKWLYLLSVIFALISVLPVAVLVLRAERQNDNPKNNIRIIHASGYKSTDELHQRIRELWWECHFSGDAGADTVLVVTDCKATRKACKELRREFPMLVIKSEKKFMEYLRTENNGEEKVHRA